MTAFASNGRRFTRTTQDSPVQAAPARKPLHPSFTQDRGTLALADHAQGAHAGKFSLVCAACRAEITHNR